MRKSGSRYNGINTREDYLRYLSDVIGDTKNEVDAYEERFAKVISRFFRLSANDTVEIVARNDEVCRACHIGKHCDRNTLDISRFFVGGDIDGMRQFYKDACSAGLKDMIQVVDDEYVLHDDMEVNLIKLKTTAGVFLFILDKMYSLSLFGRNTRSKEIYYNSNKKDENTIFRYAFKDKENRIVNKNLK